MIIEERTLLNVCRSKMESLHAMMQNEAWEAVPVEENFSLSLLPVKCCVHNFITVKGYYMYVFGSAIGKSKSSRTSAKESWFGLIFSFFFFLLLFIFHLASI